MAGSENKLAGGLDGSGPQNFKSKKSFNTPAGLWKRGKEWRKEVRSPKGRGLFVLKDYLLGLSLIFWILFLI